MRLLPYRYRRGDLRIRRSRAGRSDRTGRPCGASRTRGASGRRMLRHIHGHHRGDLLLCRRLPGDRMSRQVRLYCGLDLSVRRSGTLRACGSGWPGLRDDLCGRRLFWSDAVLLQLLLSARQVRGQIRHDLRLLRLLGAESVKLPRRYPEFHQHERQNADDRSAEHGHARPEKQVACRWMDVAFLAASLVFIGCWCGHLIPFARASTATITPATVVSAITRPRIFCHVISERLFRSSRSALISA